MNILIIEDDAATAEFVAGAFKQVGYATTHVADGETGLTAALHGPYDAAVVDIMLPKLDGFSACRQIREEKDIPVIMLSARGEEYDKLFGFELGIDDYIVKPFSPVELMARLKVVLRRHDTRERSDHPQNDRYEFDGLVIDMARRSIAVDGQSVALAPKDAELLFYLVRNRGKLLSREKILTDVWGYEFFGNDRVVDTHIRTIRNCLGRYRDFLTTHRNRGYRFEAPGGDGS